MSATVEDGQVPRAIALFKTLNRLDRTANVFRRQGRLLSEQLAELDEHTLGKFGRFLLITRAEDLNRLTSGDQIQLGLIKFETPFEHPKKRITWSK